jgi:hypothetical protein
MPAAVYTAARLDELHEKEGFLIVLDWKARERSVTKRPGFKGPYRDPPRLEVTAAAFSLAVFEEFSLAEGVASSPCVLRVVTYHREG